MTLTATIAWASFLTIAAIWVGYPAIAWLIATVVRAGPRPDHVAGAGRSVTVIIATRDPATIIRQRVANALDTEHPAAQMSVVISLDALGAHASIDELVFDDPRITVVTGDMPGGKAAALNAAVRICTSDLLVMADAQQRFDARTIPELAAALEDTRFGAVSGALELGREGGPSPVNVYWALEKRLRYSESCWHSSVGVTGAVYAVRRALWPSIPAHTLLDDVYVPMSLVLSGHRVGFTYSARAFDVRTFDSSGEGARKTRTLTGVIQLCRLLPDILSFRRNPLFLQFIAHKLLRLLTPMLAAMLLAALALLAAQWLWMASNTQRASVIVPVLAVAAIPVVRRRLLSLWQWAWDLQLATFRAVVNGLRGKWSVWGKQRGS